jgi:hypothetical protein
MFRLFQKILGFNAMSSHIHVIGDANLLYFVNGFVNMDANGVYVVPIVHRRGQSKTNRHPQNGSNCQQSFIHRDYCTFSSHDLDWATAFLTHKMSNPPNSR